MQSPGKKEMSVATGIRPPLCAAGWLEGRSPAQSLAAIEEKDNDGYEEGSCMWLPIPDGDS